jgi:hypothetical protein
MIINNKEVIQSYILTTAKYDFNVYEKRILYRLVEMFQYEIEGKKLDKDFSITKTLFDDRIVTMPTSAFLQGEDDENHSRVKTALRSLRNKTIEYEFDGSWELIGIIEKPKFDKNGVVTFELQPKIHEAILNFAKGYRKLELKTAMGFKSQYSMRFYELFSGQKDYIDYTIEHLKIMFNIVGKYPNSSDFITYVIIPAQKELDKLSPYSFTYKKIPVPGTKKIHKLRFFPTYNPENADPNIERKNLQKQVSISWDLDKLTRDYLKQVYLFTSEEIRNNIDTLKASDKAFDLMLELSKLKSKVEGKRNPKGYVIGVLKKKLQEKQTVGK